MLYNGSIDDIELFLKVIWAMGKTPKLVKTKCESDSIEMAMEGIEFDRQALKQLKPEVDH
jgi:hypothetical protein